ncbi:MAG: DegT/DnrJ/EryC1/StrS family aminotransferase [Terriglobia bacterium]
MAAIERVMESQQFILGAEVQAFEGEIAELLRTKYAVGCASGTSALELALAALGIKAGDEVITTPYTFVATAGAIAQAGAKPVFVDVDPQTFNLDPQRIESALNPKTRAIIPVHLFGQSADLEPILKIAKGQKLAVIEDAAQAIGACYRDAPLGSLGTMGCFSFFPSKNLGGAGDGGMITTNDEKLARRLRLLRVHGSGRRYHYEILGSNSRLDAIQAAVLRAKLPHLAQWSDGRRRVAARYHELFAEYHLERQVKLPAELKDRTHVYNQFVIRCPHRDALRDFLAARGIPTEIYYPLPLHLQPAFRYLENPPGTFPEAEAASRETLVLPIYPELKEEHLMRVVSAIAEFYAER